MEGEATPQSVEQFLQGLGIASGAELMGRLTGMQNQIDQQQQAFSQQMMQLTQLAAQLTDATSRTTQAEEERKTVQKGVRKKCHFT